MAKKIKAKRTHADKVERKKRLFRIFDKLVVGAVKLWFTDKDGVSSPYIVAAEDADAFIKSQIEKIK